MLTRLFALSDRVIFGLIVELDRRDRRRTVLSVRPEYLSGGHLPPVPDTSTWGRW